MEFHKNLISDFLKQTYYQSQHFINTKNGRIRRIMRHKILLDTGPLVAFLQPQDRFHI
ncbi:DUF7149 domain-containing protein [Aphanothece sacrum]|uniref:DUF7149 domain-containing protein n=1 Tax=Aphanothece sacrum TaxID=1122 RepID=UPI003F658E87